MSKFINKTRKLTDTKLVKSVRLYEDEWLAAKNIHHEFSVFARRAVLEKIERDAKDEMFKEFFKDRDNE